jgi:hypothetical protein
VPDARSALPTSMSMIPNSATQNPYETLTSRRARRAVDDAVVDGQAEGGDRGDRGHLAARPRQRVPAQHDVGEDQRRHRGRDPQPAAEIVDLEGGELARAALGVQARVLVLQRVPREEQAEGQQRAADDRDELVPGKLLEAHRRGPYPT